MAYCEQCGQKVDNDEMFCSNCGNKIINGHHKNIEVDVPTKLVRNDGTSINGSYAPRTRGQLVTLWTFGMILVIAFMFIGLVSENIFVIFILPIIIIGILVYITVSRRGR